MFRKILIALAALAVVATAAFSVTAFTAAPAGAQSYNHHHRHHNWRPSVRFFSGPAYNSYGSCYVRRIVPTAYGPRVQWVNVCY